MKNRLYFIRTQKELSAQDICELYFQRFGKKLSVKALTQIEDGKQTPTLDVFIDLAELLDVTLDFLLCRSDAPNEEVRMHQKGLVEPPL